MQYSVCHQTIGQNTIYIYALCESAGRANSLGKVAKEKNKMVEYWVQLVNDNAKIGDEVEQYKPEKIPEEVKVIDHYQKMKKSAPGKGRKYKPIHIPAVGSIYNKTSMLTYTGISDDNQHYRGGVEHRITIENYSVLIDAMPVTSAPAKMRPAQATRFCKAVITSLITDEENFDEQYSRICGEKDKADMARDNAVSCIMQYCDPVIISKPAGWINHLRLSIIEESVPA